MLVIRLARVGKKKQPTYRVVVQEKQRDPWGTSVEILGHYNPRSKALEVKKDRVEHWISNGAQMSPTVNNLFIENKVIEGKKRKTTTKDWKEPVKKEEESPASESPASEAPAEEAPAEETTTEDTPKEEEKTA